jgi:hypothetical protein
VRISWSESGGLAAFPGLARPHSLDTDDLGPDARREIEDLLAKAHFFELTAAYNGAPGTRDARTYTITVEDAGHSHTVRRPDPLEDAGLAAVVRWLRARR